MIKKLIDMSDKIIMSFIQEIVKVFFWVLIIFFVANTFLDIDLLDLIGLEDLPR